MPPSNLLSALLDLACAAAHEGSAQALNRRDAPATLSAPVFVDKPALSHALGESTARVDRMCRRGRTPDLGVADLRRFDPQTVRSALRANGLRPVKTPPVGPCRVLHSLRHQGPVRGQGCTEPVRVARSC